MCRWSIPHTIDVETMKKKKKKKRKTWKQNLYFTENKMWSWCGRQSHLFFVCGVRVCVGVCVWGGGGGCVCVCVFVCWLVGVYVCGGVGVCVFVTYLQKDF